MELSVIVIALVLLWVFKRSVKKIAIHTDRVITNELNESLEEMIDNSTTIFQNIKNKYGDDFQTPDDVFKLLTAKSLKKNTANNNSSI